MSRALCLAIAIGCLAAAPGCSSCFGGNNCRRPSFMEFQGRGCGLFNRREPAPMAAPPCGAPACAPACDPCGSAAPCCEGAGAVITAPVSAPVVSEPGTFS
jgi:hypothetical protein